MKTISANEAKQSLGRVLELAQREPVMICKYNRPSAVILSPREFDRLRGLNVAEFTEFCDRVGERASKLGLSEPGLEELLREQ
jgi:prevent-host-death family protein